MTALGQVNKADVLGEGLRDVMIDRAAPIVPQIYDQLRQRIIDNRLPPGTEVSEAVVAKQCDVSRTPLRAAMQQLAAEGLIRTRPQVGSVVAPLDHDRLNEALFIRSTIEEGIVRKLAEGGMDQTRLAPNLAGQKVAAEQDDYMAFFHFDEEFHATLADMAGVPNAWKLVHSFKAHVDRQRLALMSSITGRSLVAFGEHTAILDRIAKGNADGAAAAMRGHVASVLNNDTNRTTKN